MNDILRINYVSHCPILSPLQVEVGSYPPKVAQGNSTFTYLPNPIITDIKPRKTILGWEMIIIYKSVINIKRYLFIKDSHMTQISYKMSYSGSPLNPQKMKFSGIVTLETHILVIITKHILYLEHINYMYSCPTLSEVAFPKQWLERILVRRYQLVWLWNITQMFSFQQQHWLGKIKS